MDPYEELRRLKEENERLKAILEARRVEQVQPNAFPKGSFKKTECYEIFQEAMESLPFAIEGDGESYAISCEDGNTYYFMKGTKNDRDYLMYQVNDGLTFNVTHMDSYSFRQIHIYYGSKMICLEFLDDGITVQGMMSEEIRRIDRVIRIKKDPTRPGNWADHGAFDRENYYELEENGDIKNIKQHRKSWLNADGTINIKYFERDE